MCFVKITSVKFRYFVGSSATSMICSGLNVILILNFLSIAIPDACHFDWSSLSFLVFALCSHMLNDSESVRLCSCAPVLMMTRDAMERFGIVSALIY